MLTINERMQAIIDRRLNELFEKSTAAAWGTTTNETAPASLTAESLNHLMYDLSHVRRVPPPLTICPSRYWRVDMVGHHITARAYLTLDCPRIWRKLYWVGSEMYRDADPIIYTEKNIMYCSYRQYAAVKAQ